MPVSLETIEIKNEIQSGSVDFLLANVGDKITIEQTIKIETSAVASTDNTITMNIVDGYIPPAGSEWIFDPAGRFADFRVGDTVYIAEYNPFLSKGLFTIVEKKDDSAIRISGSTGYGVNAVADRIAISVATPITAIDYMYNLVENDDQPTFDSKVSGTKQQMHADGLDASVVTPKAMSFVGKKDYQIGSATIQGVSIESSATSSSVYISRFKIIHTTFVTPFILAEQWDDLQALIAPDYFFNAKCLKAIFDYEARYLATDPNKIQTVEISETKGNSGWLNENFNTGQTNYFLDSVIFKDENLILIPAVELTSAEQSFEIVIKNTVDSPFFTGASQKQTINFCRVPADASEYTDNNNTLAENFVFDRALQVEGAAAVNGDNFGGAYQVLKDIVVTTVSVTELKITGKIQFGASALAAINQSDDKRYMIWVATQKPSLPTATADKVALFINANEFYIDNSDPEMIVIDNRFIRHPFTDPYVGGEPRITVFPEDEVVTYSRFYIDRNGRTNDNISIRSIELKVKAKNPSTLEEFDLDQFELDTSAFPVINNHQYFDFTLDRVFHIPAGEIRKPIKIKRRVDLDAGNKFYFDAYFPYLIRWEYWKALATANQDFFDISEPNNGQSEFWHRYSTISPWNLYYEIIVKTTKNGDVLNFSSEGIILSTDYQTNPDWINETIKTYDPDTLTPLFDGASKYFLLGYKDTLVEAIFESNIGTPSLPDITVVFGIEVFEEGGIQGRRRMSSKWASDSDTWFKSLDLSSKVKLTALSGDRVKAEALVDYTKLPNKGKFKLTARLYNITAGNPVKLFQDGGEFNFQDAFEYKFQDQ